MARASTVVNINSLDLTDKKDHAVIWMPHPSSRINPPGVRVYGSEIVEYYPNRGSSAQDYNHRYGSIYIDFNKLDAAFFASEAVTTRPC